MKILFSVYNENHDTGAVTFIDSLLVQTDWSFEQVDQHIALYDGFRSEITIGDNISFFNFYCFFDDSGSLVEKIKTIPWSNEQNILSNLQCLYGVDYAREWGDFDFLMNMLAELEKMNRVCTMCLQ